MLETTQGIPEGGRTRGGAYHDVPHSRSVALPAHLTLLPPYMQTLCDALVAATFDRLNLLPPDSLAALVTGFGALGHAPGAQWMDRFCLESFARCVGGCGGRGGTPEEMGALLYRAG